MTVLSELPNAIRDQVRTQVPGLRTCEVQWGKMDLAEIKKRAAAPPAVYISVQGAREDLAAAGHYVGFGLSIAAYVITANGARPKELVAADIAAGLMKLAPSNDWGLMDVGEARDVRLHVLDTVEIRDKGLALWAVTWLQPITFFSLDLTPMNAEGAP